MARPRKEIDKKQFENLCGLQCTQEEIADFFSVSPDTIDRWCKREYRQSFAEVFREKRGNGKISLRRMQWRLAERNASMAIFLGKNYLGQRDNVAIDMGVSVQEDDPITKALKEEAQNGFKLEAESNT